MQFHLVFHNTKFAEHTPDFFDAYVQKLISDTSISVLGVFMLKSSLSVNIFFLYNFFLPHCLLMAHCMPLSEQTFMLLDLYIYLFQAI
jgi:hypothetical protein